MTNLFPDLINTRVQPGAEAQSNRNTGLKPGVNESEGASVF
jgi:hypothetical protein